LQPERAPDNRWQENLGNDQELWIALKTLRLFNLASITRNGYPHPENEPAK
jgi:hypothetical protein